MNYSDLSDFEINKLVATSLGLKVKDEPVHKDYPNTVWVAPVDQLGNQCDAWEQAVYTQCASDAWPIIVDNKIDIEFAVDGLGAVGQAQVYIEGGADLFCEFIDNSRALHAAMIVYLMMKDAENEV